MRKQGVRGVGAAAIDRHTTYFELRDAAERPGCVVCRLVGRSVRRYLEILSFESVNDLGIRKQLRDGRGFCNRHGWLLLDEVRDPFGAGIIYRDVLLECLRIAERGDVAQLAPLPRVVCPGCEVEDGATQRFLDVLTEHMHEAEMADRLLRSGGLCWRHVVSALHNGSGGLVALADVEIAAIGHIISGTENPAASQTKVAPSPGIRAGNAAPRAAPDERPVHPALSMHFGMPGAFGGALRVDDRDLVACGVCADVQRSVRTLAREHVAEMFSVDLCPGHAWTAIEAADSSRQGEYGISGGRGFPRESPLGVNESLLARQERLRLALPLIERHRSFGIGSWRWSPPLAQRARREQAELLDFSVDCSLCRAQQSFEERALRVVDPGPLCRHHWMQGVSLDPHVDGSETIEHWRSVISELAEYIRKNDYRFRDEARGAEQRSPWRGVASVAGGHGVR